jgi:PEGA domain
MTYRGERRFGALKMMLVGWLVAISCMLMLPGPAFASTPEEESRAAELKRQGDEKREEKRYEDAIALYEQSYAIVPNPAILYNKARAYDFLGEFPRALDLLEEFERKASPELKAKVNGLEKVIADVTARVSTLNVSTNVAGAEIRINGRIVAKLSATVVTTLRVKSGASTIEVVVEGYFPFRREVTLAARTETPLTVELASKMTQGLLSVSTLDGASIEVNGEMLGKTLVETRLKPGSYRVRATLDGFDPAEKTVLVEVGGRREVRFDRLKSTPITKRWWFWTAVGVVVVGGTVAVVAAVTTEKSPTPGSLGTIPTGISF